MAGVGEGADKGLREGYDAGRGHGFLVKVAPVVVAAQSAQADQAQDDEEEEGPEQLDQQADLAAARMTKAVAGAYPNNKNTIFN